MNIRKSVAGAALIGLTVFGVTACSDDNDSDSSATTSAVADASEGASTGNEEATGTAPELEVGAAQDVVVGVLSPDTDPATYADLVDSDDPAIAGQITGLAHGFSAAGYTPDKFTVTEVTSDGENTATATVEVASPHTPEPVAMPLGFVYVDGTWKLTTDAINSLVSMGGSH
ncbi:hypothetical protein [Nocardia sp. 348MFTsu5.1]|uniref:hypothetical protein n=1 Tax=Nocardia sp. 348MFTsu5.1 TaxID=1172185 RepID=UPI000363E975|nr:hypothetical protein [Nocardia sp. 348MFTsu5.1]